MALLMNWPTPFGERELYWVPGFTGLPKSVDGVCKMQVRFDGYASAEDVGTAPAIATIDIEGDLEVNDGPINPVDAAYALLRAHDPAQEWALPLASIEQAINEHDRVGDQLATLIDSGRYEDVRPEVPEGIDPDEWAATQPTMLETKQKELAAVRAKSAELAYERETFAEKQAAAARIRAAIDAAQDA